MSKTRHKSSYGKTLERLHPEKPGKTEPTTAKADTAMPQETAPWWRRPKLIQFNAGRIEISIPYQLAIAILLGLILLILVAFRLGQINQKAANSPAKMQKTSQINSSGRDTANAMQTLTSSEKILPGTEKAEPAKPTGNNRIVIQTYQLRTHLEPVRQYFAQWGIETEIRRIGDMYYLVTRNKYENPNRPGTNGYRARQIIVELGAKYQAPPGYETFGPKPFYDAYGMKFDD
ncbi:MAG: hypothetical protein ACE5NM_05835 [Sedimentisphaerales bacterium]